MILIPAAIVAVNAGSIAQAFTGLGMLRDYPNWTEVAGVSADGLTIVGRSSLDPPGVFSTHRAFRWTKTAGMSKLETPDATYVEAYVVSPNGQWVSGYAGAYFGPGADWLWHASAYELLPTEYGVAAISLDGAIRAGSYYTVFPPEDFYPYRWTSAEGHVTLPGPSGGQEPGSVTAMTPDGVFLVGTTEGSGSTQACRWQYGVGALALGDLPGGVFQSVAADVSDDGSVVVGTGNSQRGSSSRAEAFRWTSAEGMVGLGGLTSNFESRAFAVSGDGSVVVGYSYDGSALGSRAFIWDATNGMRELKGVLEGQYGLSLGGWKLIHAIDISSDGLTIVGDGKNGRGCTGSDSMIGREGWVASLAPSSMLPAPPVCGDCNCTGYVDSADLSLMLGQFGQSVPINTGADLNSDGLVNAADLSVLLSSFGESCGW